MARTYELPLTRDLSRRFGRNIWGGITYNIVVGEMAVYLQSFVVRHWSGEIKPCL